MRYSISAALQHMMDRLVYSMENVVTALNRDRVLDFSQYTCMYIITFKSLLLKYFSDHHEVLGE